LQVNLILGSVQNSINRQLIPQWAVFGHQSDDWLVAELILNIRTEPFHIEITLLDAIDSRGDVEIDDIAFTNCGMYRFLFLFSL